MEEVIRLTVCEGCGKEGAKLQCPKCLQLHLQASVFCAQSCFQQHWPQHKLKHLQQTNGATATALTTDPWPTFAYTGRLRPHYPLSPRRVVPSSIAWPDYAQDGVPRSEEAVRGSALIRQLKPDEIEKMRRVCRMAREVLDLTAKHIRPGVTTDELDRIVHELTVERGAYPSPLNYHGFPKSCCTSVNEVICHGIPDKRPLEEGDLVNLDVTLYFDGFHGDLNETYAVGQVDASTQRLIECTKQCLDKAIAIVRPGTKYREIGDIIQKVAQTYGFSVVKTYCGHGIHELFHCAPSVPHYAKNRAVGIMKPGHTFTIEPMISMGTWKDEHWPDGWTAVTQDGKRSAQFEDTLLVTETGVEILTRLPQEAST